MEAEPLSLEVIADGDPRLREALVRRAEWLRVAIGERGAPSDSLTDRGGHAGVQRGAPDYPNWPYGKQLCVELPLRFIFRYR